MDSINGYDKYKNEREEYDKIHQEEPYCSSIEEAWAIKEKWESEKHDPSENLPRVLVFCYGSSKNMDGYTSRGLVIEIKEWEKEIEDYNKYIELCPDKTVFYEGREMAIGKLMYAQMRFEYKARKEREVAEIQREIDTYSDARRTAAFYKWREEHDNIMPWPFELLKQLKEEDMIEAEKLAEKEKREREEAEEKKRIEEERKRMEEERKRLMEEREARRKLRRERIKKILSHFKSNKQ